MINQEGFDEDVQPAPDDKPPTFEPLVVTASSGDFVTVHDFVSAVHPWLTARRDLILRAKNVYNDTYLPGPNEKLIVSAGYPEVVVANYEQE
ncbi:uncharacterized protein CTRU02_209566 [Colletotrichum truncatum]|uniref:Uncharacterized protein n=1 Tax=Colletotrichum truncatum TaxID=5467 RepID=A0ACC3YSR7_COLTU